MIDLLMNQSAQSVTLTTYTPAVWYTGLDMLTPLVATTQPVSVTPGKELCAVCPSFPGLLADIAIGD